MKALVVACAWNCYEPLIKCAASIYAQDYDPLDVIIVDDCSDDERQRDLVRSTERFGWTAVLNDVNKGATCNIYEAIRSQDLAPDDVIVLVDGDDWLPDMSAVSRIMAVYEQDPDCWLTYGSYRSEPYDPSCPVAAPYPDEVIAERSFRQWSTNFNHPVTFKRLLFDQLTEEDLKLASGEWVPGLYDEAILYPLLECAADNHRFLEDVLYVYNSANSLSCNKVMQDRMVAAGAELRARPKKPRVRLDEDRRVLMPCEQPD